MEPNRMEPNRMENNRMAFTFMYCTLHDDGFIIAGNHLYVPAGYAMQHANNCECCDWCRMGMIQWNGSTFDIIENVRFDYDKFGGGFPFIGYQNTLTDEEGNRLENEALDAWIEEKTIEYNLYPYIEEETRPRRTRQE
jgi:hypothetical protein